MARKPVLRHLPPLAKLYPRFRGIPGTTNKSAVALEELRRVIEKVRPAQDAPFYSMREVGAFFGVSLKTVAQIYEKLQAEGLLTVVRGSQSLILGRKLQPRHPIRGVVGVPIYLPAVVIGNDWRALMIALEEELRRHHFVCDFIFYRAHEQFSDSFTQRLLEHQLDTVFWFCPVAANAPAMQFLLDAGIRLVVVSDGKGRFPREQYFLNLEVALHEGIAAWQRDGITRATLLHSPDHPSTHAHRLVTRALERHAMPSRLLSTTDADLPGHIRELADRPREGVIFLSHPWYESLCNQFPQPMEELFRHCRVFLVQGAPYHPSFQGKKVPADTISIPNEEIARRVARDIAQQRTETDQRLFTFHNRWLPRINLGAVTRDL